MVKSLRWRLQAWHAALLFLVIAGLETVLFLEVRRARLDEIDAELHAAARVLEGSLRGFVPPPDGRPPPGFPPRRPPPFDDDRPPPPEPREHLERALHLPYSLMDRYASSATPPYFVIWQADGTVLKASANLPAEPVPTGAAPAPEQFDVPRNRQRGSLREVLLQGPEGAQILVGRSIDLEMGGLDRLAWQLVLTGAGVFGVGLVGGWWLSRRAVAPIETMSATAATISASNLSRRIDVAGVDNELGKLGQILNAMFERLEAAFDQQIRFTADASHELRTPLSVLMTHAELALARPRAPEEYRDTLETCLRTSQRMRSMVEDLLTLARADAGKLELRSERVDLQHVVSDCANLLSPLAEEKKVTLRIAGGPAELTADLDRLAQVVTNLLTNAIHYNRPGGQVTLTTGREGNDAVLTVADTGVGIPKEELPFIFERFYRVDKARSRKLGGSGLGLAICKSIVEAHRGTITVTSDVEVGTTVLVHLRVDTTEPLDGNVVNTN